MKHHVKIGRLIFELKQVRVLVVDEFGKPYSGHGLITITDGIPHIEDLLMRFDEKFTRQDYKSFRRFIEGAGFEGAIFSRMKNGERIMKNKTL